MLSHLTPEQIATIVTAVSAVGALAGAVASYLNNRAAAGHANRAEAAAPTKEGQ